MRIRDILFLIRSCSVIKEKSCARKFIALEVLDAVSARLIVCPRARG